MRVNCIAPVARTRLTEAVAGDYMQAKEGEFDRFAPENVAAVAAWLASDLCSGISGQVVKVQGGVVQLLEGWRPLTEATSEKPWTIDSVDEVRNALFAKSDGTIPPFFFPSPGYPVKLEWSADDEAFRGADRVHRGVRADRGEGRPRLHRGRRLRDPGVGREWQATLFDHGWMIPAYPPELGGRNATPTQTLIYMEELARRRIPRSLHFPGYAIAAPSLLEFGNDEQRKLAAPSIRGDLVWCIGMSEPNAGSDLASLTTRAFQDGSDGPFIVNGQKVWTSYSMVAEKCFCYVRTDPSAPPNTRASAC